MFRKNGNFWVWFWVVVVFVAFGIGLYYLISGATNIDAITGP